MNMSQNGKVNACFLISASTLTLAFLIGAACRQTVASETVAASVGRGTVPGLLAAAPRPARHADFRRARPSADARRVADWVVDSGDNRDAPFLIVDKPAAHAYAFDRNGALLGDAPVLLGLATGDDTPPGIGDKPLSAIPPSQRITGAGRYVGELGYNLHGKDVLWVDYDEGLSLHRVLTSNPKERRAQRLASPTIADNRISYGCINVPVPFFEQVVAPAWRSTKGMVYVLPETRPPQSEFALYDVDERARLDASAHSAMHAAAAPPLR